MPKKKITCDTRCCISATRSRRQHVVVCTLILSETEIDDFISPSCHAIIKKSRPSPLRPNKQVGSRLVIFLQLTLCYQRVPALSFVALLVSFLFVIEEELIEINFNFFLLQVIKQTSERERDRARASETSKQTCIHTTVSERKRQTTTAAAATVRLAFRAKARFLSSLS